MKRKMQVRRHRAPVEVRSSTFDPEARTVEVVWTSEYPVYRRSYQDGEFNEVLLVNEKAVRMDRFKSGMSLLDSHDNWSMESRLGVVLPDSVRFENGQGVATVKFGRSEKAETLLRELQDGIPLQISVGYVVHSYEKEKRSKENPVPTYRANDWEPYEISAVPIPADPNAYSRSANAADEETYECTVDDGEDEPEVATPVARQENYPMHKRQAANTFIGDQLTALGLGLGLSRNAGESDDAFRGRIIAQLDEDDAAEAASRAAQEAARVQDEVARQLATRTAPQSQTTQAESFTSDRTRSIEILAAARTAKIDADDEIVKTAIANGTSVTDFRSQLLDVLAASQPNIQTHVETRGMQDETETRRAAVANALLHRYSPGEHTLTDAGRQYMGRSLLEVARQCLIDAGDREAARMSPMELAARALHSTSDFPIILSNITNATLRTAYEAYPQTFKQFCRQGSAPDFKEIRRVQIGEAPALLKVNEHGEFKRGSLGEGKETYSIATYGRIVSVTRQTLINDDLGAFTRFPAAFGTAIATLESDLVYSILLGNPAMGDGNALFSSQHNNIATAAALSTDAIGAARTLMTKQKGMDSKTMLNLRPAFLLIPVELETAAEQLLSGIYMPTTAAGSTPQSIRSLTPIAEPRMSMLSATNWHLIGSPSQIDTIEYAYLNGQTGPYTETRVGFDVDGVEMKVRLDFGAGVLDWRGFVRNAGQ